MQGLSGINEKVRLKATLVPANRILANSANFLKHQDEFSSYFMLALLNSRLLNFIFKATSTSSNVNGYEVNNLPFPIIDEENGKLISEIENISKQILELKSNDLNSDVVDMENQVNSLVYKLYGITDQ